MKYFEHFLEDRSIIKEVGDIVYTRILQSTWHTTNACWTLQNLLPYLLPEGKTHLAGFFFQ